ncbi:MAG TPA: hypothetical protein VHP81_03650 [Lachnospiraceae bacterium]|nr:hypothetical protein [Lachnospiraceae bacterium]
MPEKNMELNSTTEVSPIVSSELVVQAGALQAQLGVNFTLLGSDFTAMYEKTEKGYSVLLMPVNQADNKGITIDKLLEDVKKLMGGGDVDASQLTDSLNAVQKDSGTSGGKTIDVNSIRVFVRTAYLYINSSDQADAATNTGKTEYAFKLDIDMSSLLPPSIDLINIDTLSLAVWNTKRPKILDMMHLESVDKLLK